MTLQALLVIAAALFGVGVYGALSQQTFVMIMMGLELMLNGAMLAAVAFWAQTSGGNPKGQLLTVVVMVVRSEEHTSELQSLMRITYAVFCLKKKTKQHRDKDVI